MTAAVTNVIRSFRSSRAGRRGSSVSARRDRSVPDEREPQHVRQQLTGNVEQCNHAPIMP
jgi:hypothetical protein